MKYYTKIIVSWWFEQLAQSDLELQRLSRTSDSNLLAFLTRL